MRPIALLLAGICAAVTPVIGEEYLWPSEALALPSEFASTGGVVSVRGVVSFISGLEPNRFVVVAEDHPNQRGIEVVSKIPCADLACGAVVVVSGAAVARNGAVSVDADAVDVIRVERPFPPPVAKQSDYRKGLLDGRVVALEGIVRDIHPPPPEVGDDATDVLLLMDGYTATVRLPWRAEGDDLRGESVQVSGLVRAVIRDGKRIDSMLEVENAAGVVSLGNRRSLRFMVYSSVFLGTVLACALAVLLALWLRVRRERREAAVIAAERRRMAADLHDTIEQHLAGANLLAASVMQLDGAPENVRDAMRHLMSLLANAKMEVRSAVLNLREVGGETETLDAAIARLAAALAKTGVRTHRLLRGLPGNIPEGARQDMLLILQEAATNAVKHGRARTILFTCDPRADGGFVLRVLNDGAPFEVDRALGPETGHYGLSGMRERALRNRLSLSWGVEDQWSYVQLEPEVRNG
ncbi:MAG: hypothetical protein IIY62_06380 [Kiritimatiellae bacterium]|nr:hypothetical protein [Kiritimatiellia bacterium]